MSSKMSARWTRVVTSLSFMVMITITTSVTLSSADSQDVLDAIRAHWEEGAADPLRGLSESTRMPDSLREQAAGVFIALRLMDEEIKPKELTAWVKRVERLGTEKGDLAYVPITYALAKLRHSEEERRPYANRLRRLINEGSPARTELWALVDLARLNQDDFKKESLAFLERAEWLLTERLYDQEIGSRYDHDAIRSLRKYLEEVQVGDDRDALEEIRRLFVIGRFVECLTECKAFDSDLDEERREVSYYRGACLARTDNLQRGYEVWQRGLFESEHRGSWSGHALKDLVTHLLLEQLDYRGAARLLKNFLGQNRSLQSYHSNWRSVWRELTMLNAVILMLDGRERPARKWIQAASEAPRKAQSGAILHTNSDPIANVDRIYPMLEKVIAGSRVQGWRQDAVLASSLIDVFIISEEGEAALAVWKKIRDRLGPADRSEMEFFGFKKGEVLHASGHYEQAHRAFRAFVEEHPGSKHAPRALLAVGVAEAGDIEVRENALKTFMDLQRTYPNSAEARVALWYAGGLARIIDPENAIKFYRLLNRKYPDNQYRDLAADRIEEMKQ